jgi:hypothetical protein
MRVLLSFVCLVALTPAHSSEAALQFVDVSAPTGAVARHDNLGLEIPGPQLQNFHGSGVAFEDVNADGWPDIILANGESGRRVFLNNGDSTFQDKSNWVDNMPRRTSTGVALADVDNSGSLDLAMMNYYGEPFFFRGNGNSLSQLAENYGLSPLMFNAGQEPDGWIGPQSMGVAFGDVDRDGYVDMYVANYQPDRRDMFLHSIIGSLFQRTTAVDVSDVVAGYQPVFGDFDDDADLDIYVANDFAMNFYFENQGRPGYTLIEKARTYKISGNANWPSDHVMSMGVAVGDFDNDLDLDIYVANYIKNALYVNPDGPGPNTTFFKEEGLARGVQYQKNSWGTSFFDADNDGDLDLAVLGGWIHSNVPALDQGTEIDNRLYENGGAPGYTFSDVTATSGFSDTQSGRGLAVADFDRDGRLDMAAWNNTLHFPDVDHVETLHTGDLRLFQNVTTQTGHWVGLKLVGNGVVDGIVGTNAAAIGARVYLTTGDGVTRMREVRAGESFLSHNSLEVEFGVGSATSIQEVRVRWTRGGEELFEGVQLDAYQELREGTGQAQSHGVLIPSISSQWTGQGIELTWFHAAWLRPSSIGLERALDDGNEPMYAEVSASSVRLESSEGSLLDFGVEENTAYLYRLTLRSHGGAFLPEAMIAAQSGVRTQPPPPKHVRLMQNFPNPFNPRTEMEFALPAVEDVRMRLFDLRGRFVATLYDGPAPAGSTRFEFEGQDDAGNPIASGTYIYVLESSSGSLARRMTLIR